MAGETNLEKLLASMEPSLRDGDFVFATVPGKSVPPGLNPIGTFIEDEGLTLILPAGEAEALAASGPMRCITLAVHSSLDAVGLTAAFATELTAHGISANVVAGYYHDHIFVGAGEAERAMAALKALSGRYR
ncbi:ACT domain-containing protein [Rhizobium sp. TH2]|uniref:ACT domain-containing protein n=1 Tax=Rhizobium sp. TH2 TaxID=2775403 RepID=UPI00215710DF|nr:ACT domain-containing protein [Rhizobium sp. TH2]UVC09363.1 ACT domain-containing protein [Rhizobium sp. TH2]